MGPGAGADGGEVIAEGTVADLAANPASKIGPFLTGEPDRNLRPRVPAEEMFEKGAISLSTAAIHTVRPLSVRFHKGGGSTAVTGVSGSGKTTLILESLIPGLSAEIEGKKPPEHVLSVSAPGIRQVKLIDATPIGINVRSTVATYAGVHDELRKIFARLPQAKEKGYKAGDFSYNTGSLRCPTCDGTGQISLDVQFLPDVDIPCPDCRGSRYGKEAEAVLYPAPDGKGYSLPQLMAMDVRQAMEVCSGMKLVRGRPPGAGQPGAGVPDPRGTDPLPFGRRGPAAEAGQRDGPPPVGRGFHLRRADDRPAPAGRPDAPRGL